MHPVNQMALLTNTDSPRKPLVIALLGPTASGKTELAIDLAEKLQISILNVDSRQLYKGMDIGTAKPTKEQQERVPHELLNLRDPDEPITLKDFQEIAERKINESLNSKGIAFLVGGSGLYLKALTGGLRPPAVAPQRNIRKQLNEMGQEICYLLLKTGDPLAANHIGPDDVVRTQRALEVLYATGKPISTQQTKIPPPWRVLELGLNPLNLKARICKRTQQIYENGLLKETEELIERYGPNLHLLETIGYGEALQVLQSKISLAEAIEITTVRTKKFAKRQGTWFRNQHQAHWLNSEEPLSEALTLIRSVLG